MLSTIKCMMVIIFVLIGSLCSFTLAHTAEPIKMGCSVALSGAAAKAGSWLERGYRVWIDEVNERGGLLGRPVELVVYDDESDPAKAVKLWEKMISQDKISMALSPYSSTVCLAASTVTERYKLPTVSNGASSKIYSRGYKYIFSMFPPLETMGEGVLLMAKEKGYKRVAFINLDALYPKSFTRDTSTLAKEMGFEVVANEEYPNNVTDLSSLVGKLKKADPEVIIGGCLFPDGSLFMRQAREYGLYAEMFAIYVAAPDPDWSKMLGETGNYVMAETVWEESLPGEANNDFVRRFKKIYGNKYDEIEYHAAMGYAQAKIMEYAVNKAGSLDNEKIREVLATESIKNILIGDFKVLSNGYQDRQKGMKWGVFQWINGKKEIVWPDEYKTHEPVIPVPTFKDRDKKK